jgi:SAM-dependent methyltransferase
VSRRPRSPVVQDEPITRCPACGDSSRTPYLLKGALRLVRCGGCGLVYTDPQPREIVFQRYREQYDLADHFAAFTMRKEVLYRRRLAWLPTPAPHLSRLCDVGCGDGQFLELAREAGWDAVGIEPNPSAAARSRERGFKIHQGFLEDASQLPWRSFGLVTSWDSLEHTPEPRRFAQQLVRLLAPGGQLALTTLNRSSLVARTFRSRWSMVVEDHFTYWDRASLRALASSVGLTVVREESFGLGRDFVAPIDRLLERMRPHEQRMPISSFSRSVSASLHRWDAGRPFILLENIANGLLDRTALGVGLALVLREER